MQLLKLSVVAALLVAAATAQGTPPDICTNRNALWTTDHATCDFVCPDSSKWTLDCRYAGEGIQCKVDAVGGSSGAITMNCSMPPTGGNPVCSGTFEGINRTNNDCVMESIRTVLFTWQEGPAPAPAAEGTASP